MKCIQFGNENGIKMIKDIKIQNPIKWLNILIANNKTERNKILNLFHNHNISIRPAWNLINTFPMYKNCQTFNLINSKYLFDRIICLPSSVNHD